MRYDTVLFDLDGTLTDSGPGIVAGARHALETLGWPEAVEDVQLRSFVGPPLGTSFHKILGMESEQVEEAVAHFRQYYAVQGILENSVYPGIPALLRTLKDAGVRLFVATAKPEAFALQVLERFELLHFFEGVRGISMEDRHGDKAAIIRDILPSDAGRAAMVGDRGSDVQGAQDNGIDGLAVGFGYGDEEELRAAQPTAYLPDVAALSAYLLGDIPLCRGKFLTVEGVDGSGKSTQLKRVEAFLLERGYEVLRTREPGGDAVAEKIRALLLDPENEDMLPETEALLYAASRAQHVRQVILPALERGQVVLCDRFLDSSLAYQGAGRGLGMEAVLTANAMALDGLMPDLTLLFVVREEIAQQRLARRPQEDRMEREAEDFHRRVDGGFRALAQAEPERIRMVDTSGEKTETADKVETILHQVLRGW